LSGTSMAAPHVAGSAALLIEQHPDWGVSQITSALVSTAAPAWADTALTQQAAPSSAGAGRVAVDTASAPLVFTSPSTLSLGDLRVSDSKGVALTTTAFVTDAGGGEGVWTVTADTTESPPGVTLSSTPSVSVAAGGSATVSLTLNAPAASASGAVQGRLRLLLGTEERVIPFYGYVTNPGLAALQITTLRNRGRGTTADSASLVEAYRFPAAPFGPPGNPGESPLREVGGERLFRFDVPAAAINAGVAVVPARADVVVDPFILGAPDENTVLGLAATPVTANGLLPSVGRRDGAAAVLFPTPGRYWVAVDSGLDARTRTSTAGPYRIHRWIDDLAPPRLELVTKRLARPRGTIAVRALDAKSGVDPLTLTLRYDDFELGASAYDYENGIALFRIPRALPPLGRGASRVNIRASDHQEAKNILANATGFLANTSELKTRILVDTSAAHITWLLPAATRCVPAGGRVALSVSAAGPRAIHAVRFSARNTAVGLDRKPRFGDIYESVWNVPANARGRIRLVARALGADGALQQRATRVRICRQPS
ncbi:MAG: S8 family serine peptidase, partial [Gaiellaceae bacterium]